jgi:hypothetical protein
MPVLASHDEWNTMQKESESRRELKLFMKLSYLGK